jgi:hypothetical protein
MSYSTLKTSRPSLSGVGGVGSNTLSPAWLLIGALVLGGVIYSQKDKPMHRNGRRSRRLRRNSARRSSRR